MSTLPTSTGALIATQASNDAKVIDLAVLKKGAKDFLTFVDDTKEILYPYLYHRLGSSHAAETVLAEVYHAILSRALSFFWFGSLSYALLFSVADQHVAALSSLGEADIDREFLPRLTGMNEAERQSLALLHESLWTLSSDDQRVLILSGLLGLSDERIATMDNVSVQTIVDRRTSARERLWQRWQPTESVREKWGLFAFLPAMSLAGEATVRFSIVEKYNALRLRRMQWVMVGGMVALFSNMIVASFLAFVVITRPVTSLRSVERQVVAMDVLALDREDERVRIDQAIGTLQRETTRLSAEKQLRALTSMSASAANQVLRERAEAERILDALKSVRVALVPVLRYLAWEGVRSVW